MGVYELQNQCNSGGRFFSSLSQVVSKVTVNAWNVLGHVLKLTEILRHGLLRGLMKNADRKTLAFASRGSDRSFRPQSYSGHSCAHRELNAETAGIPV